MNKDKEEKKDNIKTPQDTKSSIEDLEHKVTELESNLIQMENNWKRALADYTNQQKRLNEERDEIRTRANEMLVLNLLPVLDNMEMLIKHNEDAGFKMIFKEMLKTLKEAGLEEIDVIGKELDVKTMEAIDTEEGEENKIIKIDRKGYFLNGKLIRPAKVIVGKNKEEK
jgi:molecular chaperone GrpE